MEVTEEMLAAYDDAAWVNPVQFGGLDMANIRAGLAAVLAIVERDYGFAGPCSASLPHLFDTETAEFCELRHGHVGDHEAGPTRWRELS